MIGWKELSPNFQRCALIGFGLSESAQMMQYISQVFEGESSVQMLSAMQLLLCRQRLPQHGFGLSVFSLLEQCEAQCAQSKRDRIVFVSEKLSLEREFFPVQGFCPAQVALIAGQDRKVVQATGHG